jgi:putative membrane protein
MTTAPDRATEGPTVRESVPPAREWARVYVTGVFMGTADGVPGVSGGTVALIAGVYERLIAAVTAVTPRRFLAGVGALAPLDGGVSVPRALSVWEEVDGWFLVALLGGIATAVVTVVQVVDYLDEHAPVLLFGFFFGLIAASALVLVREAEVTRVDSGAAAVAGFLLAFVVSGASETLAGGGLLVVFGAGAVAVSAMILPGISGSLLLVILSQYRRMVDALGGFLDGFAGLVTGNGTAGVAEHGPVVVAFAVGGLVGVVTIARAIERALAVNREATYAFLVALVVGALRAPVATLNGPEYDVVWTTGTTGAFAGAAVAGGVVVLLLDWYAVDFDFDLDR